MSDATPSDTTPTGSLVFGPLTFSWNSTPAPLEVTVSGNLDGVPILFPFGSLNARQPTTQGQAEANGLVTEVTLSLDAANATLAYHAIVKMVNFDPFLEDQSGTIAL